jgi:hypothetical protein
MTYLHRYVLGTVLFAGLATMSARAAEPDKLIPASVDTLVQVNIRQILDSEISKKYAIEQLKQVLDGQGAKKVIKDLGLDPLKDIDQLIIAGSGTNKADSKFMFILHGKFDAEKIYKAAEEQARKDPDNVTRIKDGNTVIFKTNIDAIDMPVYATVIDEKTVIAASEKKMISAAVAANSDNQGSQLKGDLASLFKKLDGKASILAASVVKGKLDEVKIPMGGNLPLDFSAFQDLLPKIETISFMVQVQSDVNVEITVGMKNNDAAGDFRNAFDDLMKNIKPLAQLGGAAEPKLKPLTEILGTIKSSTKSKDVVIVGKVTGANIGKMVNPNGDE